MPRGGIHGSDVPYHPGAHNSTRSVPSTSSSSSEWSSDSPYDDSDEDPTWVPERSKGKTVGTRRQTGKDSKKDSLKRTVVLDIQAGVSGKDDQIWPAETRELKVRFLDGTPEYKRLVKKLVTEQYNTIPMHLRFVFLRWEDTSTSDIRITFYTGQNNSYVGTDNRDIPQDQPTMQINMNQSTSAWVQHIVLHEFGHALGLKHEHQHPDCDFQWNTRKLKASGRTQEYIDRNYEQLSRDYPKILTPYDKESIMHYKVNKGDARKSSKYVPLTTVLSSGDKSILSELYRPTPDTTPHTIPDTTKKVNHRPGSYRPRKFLLRPGPNRPRRFILRRPGPYRPKKIILRPSLLERVSEPVTTVANPSTPLSQSLSDRVSELRITMSPFQPSVFVSRVARPEVQGGISEVSSRGSTAANGDSSLNIPGSRTVALRESETAWISGPALFVVNGNCAVMETGTAEVSGQS
ncbi:hypothetical protein PG997_002708 [Apiospora hydei]|uniref:Metalloendopeptidase n=1 Tax=Apiospora hydei TaxID=1337664 RepID=A0ABR1WX71_9PEZI